MSRRPSLRDLFTNWNRSNLPIPQRLATAMRNNFIKARTGQNCCGNHGEPGC